MVNMKREKKEYKSEYPTMPSEGSEYPCGLKIYLENEQLKKLGIEKLPELGAKMKIEAMVEVCGISENASLYDEHEHKCLTLQITDMKV